MDPQEAIFERFHQVDDSAGTDSHKPGGTGPGLAIAKEYVQLHGGSIGMASVPGRGATFTAQLPPRQDLPPLLTDPRLQRVVMNNLVSNALKLTPQGSVTVRLASAHGWHIHSKWQTPAFALRPGTWHAPSCRSGSSNPCSARAFPASAWAWRWSGRLLKIWAARSNWSLR